jgi:hypothetical protein
MFQGAAIDKALFESLQCHNEARFFGKKQMD